MVKTKKRNLSPEELLEQALVPEDEQPYELPANWVWTKIEYISFVTKLAGFEYTKHIAPNIVDQGIPLFKGKNVQNGDLVYEFESFIPASISNELVRSKLNKPCLLTPYVGTIGNVALFDGSIEAHLGPNVGKIELFNPLSEKFLLYFLRSDVGYGELTKHKKATAQESISIQAIRDVCIPIPPLSEQKRIIERVEQLLNKIEMATKIIKDAIVKLENHKKELIAHAFCGDLTKVWRGKQGDKLEDALELKKRIVKQSKFFENAVNFSEENELPLLPDKWCWCSLGELIGKIEAGKSPNAQARPAISKEEFGVLKVSAVSWGEFRANENKALFPEFDVTGIPTVKRGDLIISRANTVELVGAVVLVNEDHPNLILSDKTLRLVPSTKEVLLDYLLFALRTRVVRDIYEKATGTSDSMRNLSQEKILQAPIALAPLEEQKIIVKKLLFIDMKTNMLLTNLRKNLETINVFKKSILSKAFRGELGTNDPDEESALELLKQIQENGTR